MFSAEEQNVAAELVTTTVEQGAAAGYSFIFAETEGRLEAYACFGPIPGAPGRFDLYWIAVHPTSHRQGLGKAVLERVEAAVLKAGGERIYLDTAGREQYAPTRAFYKNCGYREAADMKDYYAVGDSKLVLMKELNESTTKPASQ